MTFGTAIDDQQLSVAWINNIIISVNLAAFFYYIDPEKCTIIKVLKGHNKPITALTLSNDKNFAFTADFEGNISKDFFCLKIVLIKKKNFLKLVLKKYFF